MAVALVSAGTPVASGSPSFGASTTAGNLLVGWVYSNDISLGFSGTGWSSLGLQATGSNGTIVNLYARFNCSAGESAPTFTTGGTVLETALAEFSGCGSSRDTGGHASGTTSPLSPGSGNTNAATGELMIAAGGDLISKAGTTTTSFTFTSGSIINTIGNNDSGNVINHWRFTWVILSGGTSGAASFSDGSMNLTEVVSSVASFNFPSPVTTPVAPRIVGQAVNRSATFFSGLDRLLWRKRSRGGLLVPDFVTV